jgi:hypothetical protein
MAKRFTRYEAAHYIDRSVNRLDTMRAMGIGPAFSKDAFSGRIIYGQADLDRYLAERDAKASKRARLETRKAA